MTKVIMHVDLNCFFARCEIIKNKALEHKPIAIGTLGRRGVISTCSYEARKYGVHSGMPSFKALEVCPQLILLPGDYHFYSLMSKEFFAYAHTFTKKVEEASIDECFIDITDLIINKDPMSFLKRFQSGLLRKNGLQCSIGVGPTRFLAKMGSDYKKPMGITVIRKKDIKKMIYPLPIRDFYGIGSRTEIKLKSFGITTIGEFAKFITEHEDNARKHLGISYDEYVKCLNGTSSDVVHTETSNPKSIGNSITLMMDTSDAEEIEKGLYMMSEEVSARLKANKVKGKTIQVVFKDTEFKTHLKSRTLDKPINEVKDILKYAMDLYYKYFTNMEIRLVGVTLSNLVSLHENNVQLSLFEEAPVDKVRDLINDINRQYNKKVVDKASILLVEKRYGHK